MKNRRTVFCAFAALLALGLSSCSKNDGMTKIGIIQLVEHPALDANCKGFIDGLAEAGYVDGKNIKIDFQNAQNEQANCNTIGQKFVNNRSDLIFAIATPAAMAVANLTKTIPIVVSSVTDPESAKLVKSNSKPDTNVTGTSDLTPCAAQMNLIRRLFPEAKKVGMLFCSNEQNSYFQISLAKAECDKLGLSYIDATVSNSNEIQQVVANLVGKVDVIYSPTDNMMAAGMATVSQVATAAKIPVITGEKGMVDSGGLCTYGIDYYKLGKQTAKMAVEILKDGKNPADMPIEYLTDCEFYANESIAKALNVTIPADLK